MKTFCKFALWSLIAAFATTAVSCSDDDTDGQTMATVELSVSVDNATNTVTAVITPSANATEYSWGWAAGGAGEPTSWNKVEGTNPTTFTQVMERGKYRFFAQAKNALGTFEIVRKDVTVSSVILEGNALVDMEVANFTPYSVDIKVTKATACAKYVVAGFKENVTPYDEAKFIEYAKMSITPDETYPFQPYNVFTESAVVPERLLRKDTPANSKESVGLDIAYKADDVINKYRFAIYAEDAAGNHMVKVSDVYEAPNPETFAFGTAPAVEITAEFTMTSITPTYSVKRGGNCVKLICGGILKDNFANVDWEDPAAVEQLVRSVYVNAPVAYAGEPLTLPLNVRLRPESNVLIYALPILDDGTFGKLSYESFTTAAPEINGKGKIIMEGWPEVTTNSAKLKIMLANSAVKMRIGAFSVFDYYKISQDMPWIFSDPEQKNFWQEITQDDLFESENLVTFEGLASGTGYYIYGASIDAEGNIGEIQRVAYITTEKEAKQSLDFTKGKGEVALTISDYTTDSDDWGTYASFKYSVKKGAHTVKAWRVMMSDVYTEEQMLEELADRFETADDFPASTEVTFDEVDTTYYDPEYPGFEVGYQVLTIVTLDEDGNYALAAVFDPSKAE